MQKLPFIGLERRNSDCIKSEFFFKSFKLFLNLQVWYSLEKEINLEKTIP